MLLARPSPLDGRRRGVAAELGSVLQRDRPCRSVSPTSQFWDRDRPARDRGREDGEEMISAGEVPYPAAVDVVSLGSTALYRHRFGGQVPDLGQPPAPNQEMPCPRAE